MRRINGRENSFPPIPLPNINTTKKYEPPKFKTMYFFTTQEAKDFINKTGDSENSNETPVTEEETSYYTPFRDIKGCEVLEIVIVTFHNDIWHRLCLRWKGQLMLADVKCIWDWNEYQTFDFKLLDEMDWKGLNKQYANVDTKDLAKPNRIGKPTAKKLDQWLEYLQAVRQAETAARDRRIAYMIAKIEHVKELFPEARDIRWEKTSCSSLWSFCLIKGGLEYHLDIGRDGNVYENLKLVNSMDDIGERMARMCHNDYTPPPFKRFSEGWKQAEEQRKRMIQRYLGQELPGIDEADKQ